MGELFVSYYRGTHKHIFQEFWVLLMVSHASSYARTDLDLTSVSFRYVLVCLKIVQTLQQLNGCKSNCRLETVLNSKFFKNAKLCLLNLIYKCTINLRPR